MVEWLLDFANPPAESDQHDDRDVIARRVAGWLNEIYARRTHPDRLAEFRQRVFRGWAAQAKHVVTIPLFEMQKGRIHVTNVAEGGDGAAMRAYALLLLLDEDRGYLKDLGQCRICKQFFLIPPRKSAGRPERNLCNRPEHRELWRKQDQRDRQERSRGNKRKARSKP